MVTVSHSFYSLRPAKRLRALKFNSCFCSVSDYKGTMKTIVSLKAYPQPWLTTKSKCEKMFYYSYLKPSYIITI